jgi:hypothetical protein
MQWAPHEEPMMGLQGKDLTISVSWLSCGSVGSPQGVAAMLCHQQILLCQFVAVLSGAPSYA